MKRITIVLSVLLLSAACIAKSKDASPPTKIEKMDLLERENAWLKVQTLATPYQKALEIAQKIDADLTAKYKLTEKDKIDPTTGLITRASKEK